MIEMPYDEAVFVLFRSRRSAPRYSRRTRSRASSPLAAASRAGAAPCPCDAVRSIPLIRQCPESPAAGCSWGDERPELTHTGYRSNSELDVDVDGDMARFQMAAWPRGQSPRPRTRFAPAAGPGREKFRGGAEAASSTSAATRRAAGSSLRSQIKYENSPSSSARFRSASPDAARCPPHLAKLRAHLPRL